MKTKFIVSLEMPAGMSKDSVRRHILETLEAHAHPQGAIQKISVSIVADPVKVPTPFKRGKVTRDPFRASRV